MQSAKPTVCFYNLRRLFFPKRRLRWIAFFNLRPNVFSTTAKCVVKNEPPTEADPKRLNRLLSVGSAASVMTDVSSAWVKEPFDRWTPVTAASSQSTTQLFISAARIV